MSTLIAIGIVAAVYVKSFKDDFKEEDINKVTPFIIGAIAIFVVFGILQSLVVK
ncbi:MAG: hypothetical protein J6A59_00680 [Lachnospiraceae bacterium]|nr:hypothetical protein [Lachnospiraceae bacterium]